MVILSDENMNYSLSFISAVVLEEEIKHTNILHSGCFKSSGIKADFMSVSDKKCTKTSSALHRNLDKLKVHWKRITKRNINYFS